MFASGTQTRWFLVAPGRGDLKRRPGRERQGAGRLGRSPKEKVCGVSPNSLGRTASCSSGADPKGSSVSRTGCSHLALPSQKGATPLYPLGSGGSRTKQVVSWCGFLAGIYHCSMKSIGLEKPSRLFGSKSLLWPFRPVTDVQIKAQRSQWLARSHTAGWKRS